MSAKEDIAILVHNLAHEVFSKGLAVVFLHDAKTVDNALKYVRKHQQQFDKLTQYLPIKDFELKKNSPFFPPALIYAPKGYR